MRYFRHLSTKFKLSTLIFLVFCLFNFSMQIIFLLTPATTTLCWIIHGEPLAIHIPPPCVTPQSPGAAGIVSSLMV